MKNEIIDTNNAEAKPFNDVFKSIKRTVASQKGAMLGDCFPLEHSFAEGLYVREIRVPAGHLVVTKTFKQTHATFLMSGDVSILTEEGVKDISGPFHFITNAGVKRVILCRTDVVWVTVHGNKDNEKDIDKIESFVIDEKDSLLGIEDILSKHNIIDINKEEQLCHG